MGGASCHGASCFVAEVTWGRIVQAGGLRTRGRVVLMANSVAKLPDRGLFAGESSSSVAPPGRRATLDISVEVFGRPAAKVRRAAATCWSAAGASSAASRSNSVETVLPDRGFSTPASEPDLPWSSMRMAAADWRDWKSRPVWILTGKASPAGKILLASKIILTRKIFFTDKIFSTGKVFLTSKISFTGKFFINRQDFLSRQGFLTGKIS